MKFRNKKTGDIKDWNFNNWYQAILNPENKEKYECNLSDFIDRVAKFREEWEDAEDINVPNMPLIKDEKVRKAVRAWAEANDMDPDSTVVCGRFDDGFETDNSGIEFDCTVRDVLSGVKRGEFYTIAELCGEEEE